MIWNSVPLMTVIDLLIISAALYCVFVFVRYYQPTRQLRMAVSANLILFGLVLIAVFYLYDLYAMLLLPFLTNRDMAMGAMMNLHLNWSWIGILVSVGAISTGLSYLIRVLVPQTAAAFADVEETRANLQAELAARRRAESTLQESHDDLERRVMARTAQLEAVRQIGLELTATLDLQTLLASIMSRAANLLQGQQGGLFLFRPELQVLELVANHGLNTQIGSHWPIGEGMVGKVWQAGRPLFVDNYRHWQDHIPSLVDVIGDRSIIGITIEQGKDVVGVLTLTGQDGRVYTEADVTLLKLFGAHAAVAIQNAQLVRAHEQAKAERDLLIADLEAKNAELERFTYTVSHDLKSPLVTVKGFLGFLKSDLNQGRTDRLLGDIERIQEATSRMHGLLNDLLEISRIGRLMNEPEIVPFADLVQEAIELVGGSIDERGVRVEVMSGLPIIRVDRIRLVEVLQNLLDNAVKFMADQPNPLITIGTRQDGEEEVFFVQDNGMGIDPKYHTNVFKLFNRLDAKQEGTGIGLALVKRIVEVHGGSVWVESAVGEGATFCFTLK